MISVSGISPDRVCKWEMLTLPTFLCVIANHDTESEASTNSNEQRLQNSKSKPSEEVMTSQACLCIIAICIWKNEEKSIFHFTSGVKCATQTPSLQTN
jgi:hypothetical protein